MRQENVLPAKPEENLRATAHGYEIQCRKCDGWHMLVEFVNVGCTQTGWRPEAIRIEVG